MTFNLEGVLICDLGLAKLRDAAQGTMITATQHMIRTYPYMAPEMFSTSHRSAGLPVHRKLFGKRRVWPAGMSGVQKVCGSYGNPPVPPQTSHLDSNQKILCDGCCQLDYKKRLNIHEVIELLNNC